MPRKRACKKRKHKSVGIEAVVEPGVGSLYVRVSWMKKLDDLGKSGRKRIKKGQVKRR